MNHYTLPEGKVQIAFSGGRTSAYMLHHILEANGDLPERVVVSFQNTGREMPETLDFVQECADRWGVRVVWLEDAPRGGEAIFRVVNHNSASRNGEPFEDLIRRKNYLPNQDQRFCTENLKILPARRYAMSMGWKEWSNAKGIRADEKHRAKPSKDHRIAAWYPLFDAGVSKRDVLNFWKSQPFDLQVAEGYGNCDGCFLKSEAQLAALCRDNPDRHKWWQDMEDFIGGRTLSSNGARFRKEYSRREIQSMVRNQGDWIFDTEGALCQASGGECV